MRCVKRFLVLPVLALIAASALSTHAIGANIVFTGDYSPTDPANSGANWNATTDGYVGNTTSGAVSISSGILASQNGYLGYTFNGAGTATVDGTGSAWNYSASFYVGYDGYGELHITNGGAVNGGVSGGSFIGYIASEGYGLAEVVGTGSTWSNSSLAVGNDGNGTLHVLAGGLVSTTTNGVIGYGASSTSTATVDGGGSKWTLGGNLNVGQSGFGTLYITNGGSVSVGGTTNIAPSTYGTIDFGATGGGTLTTKSLFAPAYGLAGTGTIYTNGLVSNFPSLTYDGADLTNHGLNQTITPTGSNVAIHLDLSNPGNVGDLGAGYGGNGVINIRNGITVNSANGYLGYDVGSAGTAYVDGAGSAWSMSGEFDVGLSGYGSLQITNGGAVSDNNGFIGAGTTAAATVDGAGSTWTNRSGLYVGQYSTAGGTLNVTNGGYVQGGYIVSIGNNTGSSGQVTVSGKDPSGHPSTLSIAGILNVGQYGQGTLLVQSGGSVSNTDNAYIGNVAGAAGTVTVDGSGSTWTNGSDLYVGWNGAGRLNIYNGGAVSVAGTTYVAYAGTSTGQIDFGSNGGTLTTNGLTVSPNQLTGTGTINTHGLISDLPLVFNGTSTPNTAIINAQGQDITVNLDWQNTGNVGQFGVGYTHTGSVLIDGTTVTSTVGYLGYQAGSTGSGTVTNNGTWSNGTGNLNVGYKGAGTLYVTNGGTVTNASGYVGSAAGSVGAANVDGAGSTWSNAAGLYIGYLQPLGGAGGSGTLNVTNGGYVANTGNAYISFYATANGSATVAGHAKWTNTGNLYVGYFGVTSGAPGSAALSVNTGGTVTDASGYIANNTGSIVNATIDGGGSTWTNSGTLYVGYGGTATLNVQNGGYVSSATGYVGYNSGVASGTATVTGSGSMWSNTGSLYVAYSTSGNPGTGSTTLNVANGGAVSVAGTAYVGDFMGQTGTLNLSSGGTFSGIVKLGNAGTFHGIPGTQSTGNLNFDGGTLKANAVSSTWISNGAGTGNTTVKTGGATFDTSGLNMGIGVALLHGGTATDGGVTKVGAGTLTLTGANSYTGLTTVNGGALELGASARNPVLTLGGGADVISGKLVFDYSGSSILSTLIQPAVNAGTIYRPTANPPLICIDNLSNAVTVESTLPGDTNLDGSVNGTDLNTVLSNYNLSGMTWSQGDFNGDGSVNGTDLNIVLSNYNQSVSLSAGAAVPEPSTLLLAAAGLVGLLACAWRKRK